MPTWVRCSRTQRTQLSQIPLEPPVNNSVKPAPNVKVRTVRSQSKDEATEVRVPIGVKVAIAADIEFRQPCPWLVHNRGKVSPHEKTRSLHSERMYFAIGIRSPPKVERAIPVQPRQVSSAQPPSKVEAATDHHFAVWLSSYCISDSRGLCKAIKPIISMTRRGVQLRQSRRQRTVC